MELHILNGDALTERVKATGINGKIIITRECLIDGPAYSSSIENFWEQRAEFISKTFNGSKEYYYAFVVKEFEQLKTINKDSEINLWFENDLFCQCNMWFVVKYLDDLGKTKNVYRVFPKQTDEKKKWHGFGILTIADLKESYLKRVQFSNSDIDLSKKLWSAYSNNNILELGKLAKSESKCFRDLQEVIEAHIDRFPQTGEPGRPERTLQQLIKTGKTDFYEIFEEFFKTEGIYGFGDAQVKNMLTP